MNKYYIDTSIWIDLYDDRHGYNGEPLGDFALKLFYFIRTNKHKLIISDVLIKELQTKYTIAEINGMTKPFEDITEKVYTNQKQNDEAKKIALEKNLPPGDVAHAILSRDNNFILVTRDNDFKELKNIAKYYKPEELI